MTKTEAFAADLSQSSDATVLRGKTFLLPGATTTPNIILTLTPGASGLGVRANALSGIFSRYRFKYLKVKMLSATTSGSAGFCALGVLDDTNSIAGDLPTTFQGVAELRCSGTSLLNQTIPTQWEWSPVDKTRWYYTQPDSTDTRFQNSGVLLLASNGIGTTSIEIDFCIVFKGASDVGSQ